ncbi:MAG: nitroreductase family protein [Planctomycetota bacterium]|jgi:nitroreductase
MARRILVYDLGMDVQSALHGRRTVHLYKQEPVAEETIMRALAAAAMAPNHKLTWPWRFTRVGQETRARLAEVAVRLKAAGNCEVSDAQREKICAKVTNPAELLVVSLVREKDPVVAREDYASAACAIQNIQLSLHAEGVGSKWSSGKLTCHPESYEILGIDADSEEIVGFIWAGIAEQVPRTPQRPALDELVRTRP